MKEKSNIIIYLLSGNEEFLPMDYPEVDLKKMRKKSELQKARIAKRMLGDLINELKD